MWSVATTSPGQVSSTAMSDAWRRARPDLSRVAGVICPKCQNTMRTVDRMGVHIDQCDGCRGIFLDRGELEAIAGAEQQHYNAAAPPPYQPAPPVGPDPRQMGHGGYVDSPRGHSRGGYGDSPRGYGRGGYGDSPHGYRGGHGHKRRRGGFLEQLFD